MRPRLEVNVVDAAIGAALDGRGITRAFEPERVTVHVVHAASSAKVRAFVDLAVPTLRAALR